MQRGAMPLKSTHFPGENTMFRNRMMPAASAAFTRFVPAGWCHPAVHTVILFCALANQGYAQGCLNAAATGPVFQMSLLPLQQGEFMFEVNATPKSAAAAEDGGIGLARGRFGQFDDLAVSVRFSPQGTVDMRDGNVYRADRVITYAANETYHIRLIVNTNTHRYSAYIRLLRLSA